MSKETPVVRTVREIQERLAALVRVIHAAKAFGTPDVASKLEMRSLLAQCQELRDELEAAKAMEGEAGGKTRLERNRETDTRNTLGMLSIGFESCVAAYLQIENQIQFAIASGRLRPGDRLPSVRETAERLGVDSNTVAKSYRDLELMGFLHTQRGMGIFIRKNIEAECRERCRHRIIGRLHEVVAEARASGMIPKEILDVFKASLAEDASPYGGIPESVANLAKASGK